MCALAIVAFTGCSDKEQSSFNINDIPGKAKIIGTFAYDAGQGFANGTHTQLIKAASNVRVVAKVDNSTILSSSEGYTIYETYTDGNGNYSIEVPAHYKNDVSVQIVADPFFATYSRVVDVNKGNPTIEKEDVLFKLQEKTVTVTPNDIEINDGTYTYNDRTILEAYKYNSTFIVKVGEGQHNKKKNERDEYYVSQEYVEANGKNVLVKINDVLYGATTNASGEARFIIPSEHKAWQANAAIEVPGYVSNNYEYFKEEYDQETRKNVIRKYTIAHGIYQQVDHTASIIFNGIDGTPAPVCKIRMNFTPFADEEDFGYFWNNLVWED